MYKKEICPESKLEEVEIEKELGMFAVVSLCVTMNVDLICIACDPLPYWYFPFLLSLERHIDKAVQLVTPNV